MCGSVGRRAGAGAADASAFAGVDWMVEEQGQLPIPMLCPTGTRAVLLHPTWPERGPAGTGCRGRGRWCLGGWEPMSKQRLGAVPFPPRNDAAAQPAQQRLCFSATSAPPHCSCSSTLGKKESVVPAQSHLLCYCPWA